jgi:GNAT superfamily N-acetyltransferase
VEGSLQPADVDIISKSWAEHTGGAPVYGLGSRAYMPEDVEGLAWVDPSGGPQGIVTWAVPGDIGEIVSVHAFEPDRGLGDVLMDAAELALRDRGCRRVVVATTNDNPGALNFYVRRGYRLVRLHLDVMDRVRALKPGVPVIGRHGIPLSDMWEMEKEL